MPALLFASLLAGSLTTIHVVVSIFLVIVILLQPGKGEGMGALGGGGAGSAFGARGSATFLSKVTTGCAVVFMLTSLSLSYLATRSGSVVLQRARAAEKAAPTPVTPPAPAAPTTPAPTTNQAPAQPIAPAQAAPTPAPSAPEKK